MLVSMKNILKIAEAEKCAIGSFNTPNLESLLAVISAAEELGRPVIIMHAEIHEELVPLDVIGPIMVQLAEKSTVPVCVHLDHGTSLDYLHKAIDLGFTSIMYDGSVLDCDTNIANTCIAVEMARRNNVSVEAEIGVMTRPETSSASACDDSCIDEDGEALYTNPEDAKSFVDATCIDALACSFGTAHGIYTKEPRLDFDRLSKIKALVNIPLVMHGGSGVSEADYKKAISCGIRKINYFTYMSKAGGEAVRELMSKDGLIYFHDVYKTGIASMKENVKTAIRCFTEK